MNEVSVKWIGKADMSARRCILLRFTQADLRNAGFSEFIVSFSITDTAHGLQNSVNAIERPDQRRR